MKNIWPLLDFARMHGKMQVAPFVDRKTGKEFRACTFTHPTMKDVTGNPVRIIVYFNSDLGVLTPKEIVEQKDELYVVRLSSGDYELCKNVNNTEKEHLSYEQMIEEMEKLALEIYLENNSGKTLDQIREELFTGVSSTDYGPNDSLEHLNDFVLPDGSIYNGQCIARYGRVELSGMGEISFKNGDKYEGEFKYGRPYGWGKYSFKIGHSHKGYFDAHPKGIGYLNENYGMAVGNFLNGRLNGWGICYRNHIFKFGYWDNGRLSIDKTDDVLWIMYEIGELRLKYRGNLIQIDEPDHNFIRFGVPEMKMHLPSLRDHTYNWPAEGFEFFKDGSVKAGEIRNGDTGRFIHYKADGTVDSGVWRDNIKVKDISIRDLKGSDEYYIDGLEVFKKY